MKSGKKATKTKKGSEPSSSRIVTKSNNSLPPVISGPIPSKISDKKWQKIIEEEDVNFLINSIRAEIVQSAIDEIYKRYLDRTSYSFVVRCAYLAWLQCFELMDLKYDPGETPSSIEKSWSPDEECKPVPRDSWTCRNIPIRLSKKPEIIHSEPKICKRLWLNENAFKSPILKHLEECSSLSTQVEMKSSRTRRKQQEASTTDTEEESPSQIDRAEELSIFTQTISMSRQDLPMPKWPTKQTSSTYLCTPKISNWNIDASLAPPDKSRPGEL